MHFHEAIGLRWWQRKFVIGTPYQLVHKWGRGYLFSKWDSPINKHILALSIRCQWCNLNMIVSLLVLLSWIDHHHTPYHVDGIIHEIYVKYLPLRHQGDSKRGVCTITVQSIYQLTESFKTKVATTRIATTIPQRREIRDENLTKREFRAHKAVSSRFPLSINGYLIEV
jgi:hypothetical protein